MIELGEDLGPPFTTLKPTFQVPLGIRRLVERRFVQAMREIFRSKSPVVFAVLPPTELQRVEGVRVVDVTVARVRPVTHITFQVKLKEPR